jgi:hypothetical protein
VKTIIPSSYFGVSSSPFGLRGIDGSALVTYYIAAYIIEALRHSANNFEHWWRQLHHYGDKCTGISSFKECTLAYTQSALQQLSLLTKLASLANCPAYSDDEVCSVKWVIVRRKPLQGLCLHSYGHH